MPINALLVALSAFKISPVPQLISTIEIVFWDIFGDQVIYKFSFLNVYITEN